MAKKKRRSSREDGTNPRAKGTNPRAKKANPRALGETTKPSGFDEANNATNHAPNPFPSPRSSQVRKRT